MEYTRLSPTFSLTTAMSWFFVSDPNAPAAVKARAAYYILTLATKAMETDDIDARVLALERAAELTNQGSMNCTPQPESQW